MTSRQTEAQLALAITQFLHQVLPPDAIAFHVPNEGRRTVHERSRFLASGGKAGIPDRWILWHGRAWCWEEKTAVGRLNNAQQEMFPRLEAAGFPVPIIRSVEAAEYCLLAWGIPLRGSLRASVAALTQQQHAPATQQQRVSAQPRKKTQPGSRTSTAKSHPIEIVRIK